MKKRVLSLLVVSMLVVSMLAGCAKDKKTTTETTTKKETTKEETSTTKEETTTDGLVVAFIYDGEIGDGGYTQAHDDARKSVEAMEGVSKVLYKESVAEDTAVVEQVCEDFIAQGATLIFGTSFGFQDGMLASAEKHPEVTYEHFSGYYSAENYGTYFGKIYQMRYLTGIVAGLQTETNKIGYVAAFAIPEVIRGINAFALGVKSVNPEATIEVSWSFTWNNAGEEKSAAVALIDKGCDIIAQHQNTTGAQTATEGVENVWGIGYNKDMSSANPTSSLTAAIWNHSAFCTETVKKVIDGTWTSEAWWGGATTGAVDIAPLTANVKDGIAEVVEAEKTKIFAGEDKIFVGPLKDNEGNLKVAEGVQMTDAELLSIDWFVDNVIGSTK